MDAILFFVEFIGIIVLAFILIAIYACIQIAGKTDREKEMIEEEEYFKMLNQMMDCDNKAERASWK